MIDMTELVTLEHKENGMRVKIDRSSYVTVKELAERAGLAPTTIYYWISEGLIEAERSGLKPKSQLKIKIAEANRVLSELSLPPIKR